MLPTVKIFAKHFSAVRRGYKHWQFVDGSSHTGLGEKPDGENLLWKYFKNHKTGRGIWKWNHYFEIYDRHFRRFRGQDVHVLEIGIYSGGSLEMWRDYFGPQSHIYGVDIATACKAYEDENVHVFIGDQADRNFWQRFRSDVPLLDIVIDDGGHLTEQQIVTLEEMLPHLRRGGVYVCEDAAGESNKFMNFVDGLMRNLNAFDLLPNIPGKTLACAPVPFQSDVQSEHRYPYVVVIEKGDYRVRELRAPAQGSDWTWKIGRERESAIQER